MPERAIHLIKQEMGGENIETPAHILKMGSKIDGQETSGDDSLAAEDLIGKTESREIDISKLAYEHGLGSNKAKKLVELVKYISLDEEIHSNTLSYYYNELPINIIQSPEIITILKGKLSKSLLNNENIGNISPYIVDFGIDMSFFADKKFDSYRKHFWQKKIEKGAAIDFKLGKERNGFFDDAEVVESPLERNFGEIKNLFSTDELKKIGLDGALSAAQGDNYFSRKKEEKIEIFNEYKKEFNFSNIDIEGAMIKKIEENIFSIGIPDELIDEFPEVKKFLSSPEARGLAMSAALEKIALGYDVDDCLKRFKIDKKEFSQKEIIEKINKNIENNKIEYRFNLESFSQYVDETHLPELGQAILKLKDSLKEEFFNTYFSKADWTFDKSDKHLNDLAVFKKLNFPQEVLVNFVKNKIIDAIRADRNAMVQDSNGCEFFGVGGQEKQAALSIGYFYYVLNRAPQHLNQPDEYAKKKIGLNNFIFTPEFRQKIKEEYLAAIRRGDTITLNSLNEFLERENETVKWEATDRPLRIEAVAEGSINICNYGRDAIKSFVERYHPGLYKFFFWEAEYKLKLAEKLTSKIIGTIDGDNPVIDRKKLLEAISYFPLKEEDILNQVDEASGFLKENNRRIASKLLPSLNVKEHNARWIDKQDPRAVLDFAIARNNYELWSELLKHEKTKELAEKELVNTENKICNTSLFVEQADEDIDQIKAYLWIIKNSLDKSYIGEGVENNDKQLIFSQDYTNAFLILKHLSTLSPEKRSNSVVIKLSARKNENIFFLIKEVMQAAEINILSAGLKKKLEDDFGLQVDDFNEGDIINAEKILAEIEKSIEKNFDANLTLQEPLQFDTRTEVLTRNALADTEVAVLNGDHELGNEELFSKIYRKYLSIDEQHDNRFNTTFYQSTSKKMTKDYNFFNEKDWGAALITYLDIVEGGNEGQKGQKKKITDLFSGPYRDNCLNGISSDWNKFLDDQTRQDVPLRLRLISDKINKYGGAGNLSRVEIFSRLITVVKNVSESEKTTDQTKEEIKNILYNAEKRFEKEKWTQDDKSEFYGLVQDIIEASPSLFSSLSPVIESMPNKEIKRFIKEIFPLYQAELITVQKTDGDGEISYEARDLVPIRREIKSFIANLSALPEKKEEIISSEKDSLITSIRLKFKERFGISNVPAELSNENFRSVHNLIRYTGNINDRDVNKESLVSLYLGLQLNGDWEKFRRGEKIEITNYLTPEKAAVIRECLAGKETNSLSPEMVNIKPEELALFQEKLQAEVTSSMIGNLETIDSKLGNAKRGIEHLLDPDLYDDQRDKNLIPIITRKNGQNNEEKLIGAVLAKTFQSLKNGNVKLNDQEKQVQASLALALDISTWTEGSVKEAQDRAQSLGLISKVLNRMEDAQVDENIAELNNRIEPSEEIIKIFNKLDLGFKSSSGAMAVSQDLETLASLIVKEGGKLSAAEKESAKKYLDLISEKKAELEGAMLTVKEYFEKIQGAAQPSNLKLKDRLKEIKEIIYSSSGEKMIVSEMTKDINLIVENMRQCLGCLRKEKNNDTNLAFGDYNKFFIISREEKNKGSVADEIVFFVPTKKENGETTMSFVMDRIYGSQKSDILISHILAVYKKYESIKKQFKGANVSIAVSSEAMGSVGIKPGDLQKILKEKIPELKSSYFLEDIKADIPTSSFSDNYIEFGEGGARQAGERKFKALIIE